MSVSFHLDLFEADSRGWQITCYIDCHNHNETYPTWDETCAAYKRMLTTGEVVQGECYTSTIWDVDDSCDFSLANSNARDVLRCLGFGSTHDDATADELLHTLHSGIGGDVELYGTCPGEDLLGRIAVARAAAPDISRHASTEQGPLGATVIDYGRDAGYLNRALDNVERLAHLAVLYGRDVVWN